MRPAYAWWQLLQKYDYLADIARKSPENARWQSSIPHFPGFLSFSLRYIAALTPNTPSMAVAIAAMIFRIIDAVCFPFSLMVVGFLVFGFWEVWESWED